MNYLQSLAKFSSCEISDALVKMNRKNGGLIPDLELLSPAKWSNAGESAKIIGPAYTVKMVDNADTTAPKPNSHYVDSAVEGSIMVISAPSHLKSAVFGGLMGARCKAINCLGVVVDGRVRDLGEHRSANFHVFARGHSTLPQGAFARPSELNVPITIKPQYSYSSSPSSSPSSSSNQTPFPDTHVDPGDIIVGDIDGVVVVPQNDIKTVVELCEKIRSIDDKCMQDIVNGRSVAETFREHRGK